MKNMASTYKIEYTQQFKQEARNIYEYIASELDSPKSARRKLERIVKAVNALVSFPKMHKVRKRDTQGREFRSFPVEDYVVVYLVDDKKYVVNVIHVLHSKRNIDDII